MVMSTVVEAFQEISALEAHGKGWWGEVSETVNSRLDGDAPTSDDVAL